MVQAKLQDQEPVRILTNFASGTHSGYAGDVMVLPSELAAQLIEAGAAEEVDLKEELVDDEPVDDEPKVKGKGSK